VPGSVLILKEVEDASDSEYRRRCLELVEQLDISDAVRTVGELDRTDLLELYAAADVYVSVPDRDGTAVSVLEAMAAGVPIVASDAPGIDSAIMRPDETALLVPTRDAEALAVAVVSLATSPERRRSLVERARTIVRLHGDFDRELDRAVQLYEELVATRTRARARSE
jgi:glycosyltransferase involved in cell wall biosynthesis